MMGRNLTYTQYVFYYSNNSIAKEARNSFILPNMVSLRFIFVLCGNEKLIKCIPFDDCGFPSISWPNGLHSICFVCHNSRQCEENDANVVLETTISNYIIPIMSSELGQLQNILI